MAKSFNESEKNLLLRFGLTAARVTVTLVNFEAFSDKADEQLATIKAQPARPPASTRPAAARQPAERSSSAAPSLRGSPQVPLCPLGLTRSTYRRLPGCKSDNTTGATRWAGRKRQGSRCHREVVPCCYDGEPSSPNVGSDVLTSKQRLCSVVHFR